MEKLYMNTLFRSFTEEHMLYNNIDVLLHFDYIMAVMTF